MSIENKFCEILHHNLKKQLKTFMISDGIYLKVNKLLLRHTASTNTNHRSSADSVHKPKYIFRDCLLSSRYSPVVTCINVATSVIKQEYL